MGGGWNCWEYFKIKDADMCKLTVFKTMLLEVELLKKLTLTVHSNVIWNDVLEVGSAEKRFKARSLYNAFCLNLKRCFGNWNLWDFFLNLSQYERMFWRLELLRNIWKRGRLMLHSSAIWNDVLKLEQLRKLKINRSLNGAFWLNLERCKMRHFQVTCSYCKLYHTLKT